MKLPDPEDAPLTPAPTNPAKQVKKAGFLIHGIDRKGNPAMVAAYNEGRLGAKYKAYVLPTGTINQGEHIIEGAARETFEETGINVKEMLGRNNWERLKTMYDAGESVYLDFGQDGLDVQSGPYKGVSILRVKVKPEDFTYVSHAGVEKRTQLFEVELKRSSIDLLRENRYPNGQALLKNAFNTATEGPSSGKVKATTWQQIQPSLSNRGYPTFKEMLDWLRTGDMPENRAWNRGKPVPANLYADTPYLTESTGQLFEKLERQHFKGKPAKWNHEIWKDFLDDADTRDYKRLSKAFTAIKEIVDKMGVTIGDSGVIKLDDKDFPLTFYQEGADVICAHDYFLHAERLARKEPYYNKAFIELPEGAEEIASSPASPLKSQYEVLKARFPSEYKQAQKTDEKTLSTSYVERLTAMRGVDLRENFAEYVTQPQASASERTV